MWTIENNAAPGSARDFFQDDNGTLWFNFYNNITQEQTYASYDGTNWSYLLPSDIPGLGDHHNLKIVDPQGNWWTTIPNGIQEPKIYRTNEVSSTPFDTQIFPLGTNSYDNIVADCDNNIWMMGSGCLSKLNGQDWENFTTDQTGFVGDPREAVIDPTDCNIWFALYNSNNPIETDVGRYDGSEFETLTLDEGTCLSVDISNEGTLYFGTTRKGIGQYVNGNWTFFNESNSPINDFVSSVRILSDGTLWAASFEDGIGVKTGEDWSFFNSSNSPVDDFFSTIHIDKNENVFVRSGENLAKFNGTNWEIFSFDLPTSGITDINCIEQDHLGNYWIGTQEGALYWNGFDFTVFDITNSNIGSNSIRNIHIDSYSGDIWFVHYTGVSLLQKFHQPRSINGIAFFDANQDGVFDSGEDVRLPNQQILLLPDSTHGITNSLGAYSFYPSDPGSYQIQYEPVAPYLSTSPSTIDTFFSNETIVDLNFAAWSENIPEHISVDVVGSQLICNEELTIWVTFRNEGFLNVSGEINLSFDSVFTYLDAIPEPSNIELDQVTWDFSDLSFMESRTYRLNLTNPDVEALDEFFEFMANILADNVDENYKLTDEVLCSYDPNDKKATPLGIFDSNYSLLNDPIQYTIRFQNMGNFRARDILISDTIDPSLDISTFQIISSSHEMKTTIGSDRNVDFRFEDINLPPEEDDYLESQGFVKYQISPMAGLADPTIIHNTASIYFDLNPAIVTNTTENILVESLTVSSSELETQQPALVYPNPSTSEIHIEWPRSNTNSAWKVEIYDISGKLILDQAASTPIETLYIPEGGFYFFKIIREGYVQLEKVIILNQ